MRKILLPYDGSTSSQHAVRYVADKFRDDRNVQIHVLNVQELPTLIDPWVDATVIQKVQQELNASGEKLVMEAARTLQESAVPHQLHVHLGLVPDVIAKEAESIGCESIVMGTRGRGTFSGFFLGSTAMKVVHLAHVPVTLVK